MGLTSGRLRRCTRNMVRNMLASLIQSSQNNTPGPIVRINADELHINDPSFYSTIYAGGGRRINKHSSTVAAYTVPNASLATVDHDRHRVRRAILNPYFS